MKITNLTIPVLEGDVRSGSIQEKGAVLIWDATGRCFKAATYSELFSQIDSRMKNLEEETSGRIAALESKNKELVNFLKENMTKLTNMVETVASKEE